MPVHTSVENVLGVTAEAKPGVYISLFKATRFSVNYVLELLLSAGIATLGLVLNSPAVVIGGMLVSPLMGPILATGLSLAASDVYLGIKCLINLVLSILLSVLFSAALVWILPFHSPTGEILARTQPNLLDLGVALFSGLAGSLVVCRGGHGGGVTALPGVAIAVALMPPLCTVGFGIGSGVEWTIISGAGLLFLTNLAAIVACAFGIFLLVRMGSMDVRKEIGHAELEEAAHDAGSYSRDPVLSAQQVVAAGARGGCGPNGHARCHSHSRPAGCILEPAAGYPAGPDSRETGLDHARQPGQVACRGAPGDRANGQADHHLRAAGRKPG